MAWSRADSPPLTRLSLFFVLVMQVGAFSPLRAAQEASWRPARQTASPGTAPGEDKPDARVGWSPRPTDAPKPALAQMELFKRQQPYSMGTDTCGFISGYPSLAVTCVKGSGYCTNDGVGNIDCCTGEYTDCTSTMFSACLDFSASQRGACASRGPRTICCWESSPACYTLIFSTTATPGRLFSILQCQSSAGVESLLATPPALLTSSPRSSSSSITQSTTTSTISTTTSAAGGAGAGTSGGGGGGGGGSGESSPTPVAAIVGGAVGGVALVGLVVFAICLIMQRSRRAKSGYQPPPHQIEQVSGGHVSHTSAANPGDTISTGQNHVQQHQYVDTAYVGSQQKQAQGQLLTTGAQGAPTNLQHSHHAHGQHHGQQWHPLQQLHEQPPQQTAELPLNYPLGTHGHPSELR
ncbi:hypothetical protein RB601_000375 [Gaeumannomyces tritici]